ncbi:Uncharacterized protein dnl_43570 [Desulfonema limicola]|uniref:Uncharacterized protein n=1 Tax=Desulfonema limicola TaxID=45656 RepID=A0A975BAY4_9BACT|nr:hypothetical protein [Desulfonema limicola]QTA81996.1 Uncharacterized protein dnl_43570 [Desulfonema limicola]
MRQSFMIFLAILMSMIPINAFAGDLEPVAGPAETNSYSMEDIYNRLDTGADGEQKIFTGPTAGPGPTGHTIDQLMEKMPAKDTENGAAAADVLKGKTFWGLGETWGTQPGTMDSHTGEAAKIYTPGAEDKPIDKGFHDGSIVKGDENLVPGNIGLGVSIFGIAGTAAISTGDASPDQVLKDVTFSNADGPAAGTMSNYSGEAAKSYIPTIAKLFIDAGYHSGSYIPGEPNLIPENILSGMSMFGVAGNMPNYTGENKKTYNPGTEDIAVNPGYHDGSIIKGDPNLLPKNIASGVTIFEVTGTSTGAGGNATDEDVLEGVTYSNSTGQSIGTIPKYSSLTYIPTTEDNNLPTGYYENYIIKGEPNLLPGNIVKGKTIFNVAGTSLKAEGDAIAENVLENIKFSSANGTATGTMPNYGGTAAKTYTPTTEDQTIDKGYHDSSVVQGDPDLLSENILKDTEIFGVTGTIIEAKGNAIPAQVLEGFTFSSATENGLTGTIPIYRDKIFTPGKEEIQIDRGYYSSSKIATDANLLGENIKNGVIIFGVTGTYDPPPASAGILIWVTNGKWTPGTHISRKDADALIENDINKPEGYSNHFALISFPGDTIESAVIPGNLPVIRAGEKGLVVADNWNHFIRPADKRPWYNSISDSGYAWTGSYNLAVPCKNSCQELAALCPDCTEFIDECDLCQYVDIPCPTSEDLEGMCPDCPGLSEIKECDSNCSDWASANSNDVGYVHNLTSKDSSTAFKSEVKPCGDDITAEPAWSASLPIIVVSW